MRLVYSFVFGSACIVFSLAMFFEVVRIGDIVKYCEASGLMLIDSVCPESLPYYGMQLFVGGMVLASAGLLCITSVLISPRLPSDGMKI